jgi:hypothetical protein
MTRPIAAGRSGFFPGADLSPMPSDGRQHLQSGPGRGRGIELREVPATDQAIRAASPAEAGRP